jgi:hypothetical protein
MWLSILVSCDMIDLWNSPIAWHFAILRPECFWNAFKKGAQEWIKIGDPLNGSNIVEHGWIWLKTSPTTLRRLTISHLMFFLNINETWQNWTEPAASPG